MGSYGVDDFLKRALLSRMIMGPKRSESGCAVRDGVQAKEILEALRIQRIAFQIQEQVAGIRLGQSGKAASWSGWQDVHLVRTRVALDDVQPGLRPQP